MSIATKIRGSSFHLLSYFFIFLTPKQSLAPQSINPAQNQGRPLHARDNSRLLCLRFLQSYVLPEYLKFHLK